MSEKTRKRPDPLDDLTQVASFTECTGLMPSLPQNEHEDESYSNLYTTRDQSGDDQVLMAQRPKWQSKAPGAGKKSR